MGLTKRQLAARKRAAEAKAPATAPSKAPYCDDLSEVYADLSNESKKLGDGIKGTLRELKSVSGAAMPYAELSSRQLKDVQGLGKTVGQLKRLSPSAGAVKGAISKLCKLNKDAKVSCAALKDAASFVKAEKKVAAVKSAAKDLKCPLP